MGLSAGTRLGPYEVVAALGAGGMGEVYSARDTRLGRTVALKILPTDTIPSDSVRQRFEREARAVSQLSHPHICTLFDVGREGEIDFLVMELVEGETLQARLARGPLPLAEVLRSGTEIADALDRAHRSGVVHRDLKPGNVMLTKSGIKLLDFGLARAFDPVLPASGFSELKTASAAAPMTAEGTIVGTLQYMAPEQLEGKPADARSDVFALGCVLHEMATGRRAFEGTSPAAVASEILRGEAPPLATLRADCPPALEPIVRGCLAKDPDERWQSAHDVKLQLGTLREILPATATGGAGPRKAPWIPWVVAALATSAVAVVLLRPSPPRPAPSRPIRFSVPPPEGSSFAGWTEATTFSLSPDGSTLAFVATNAKGRRLYLRPLSSLEAKPVEGTEGVLSAFWSPDGKALGFFADRKLKRLDLGSGAPVPICDVRPGAGITGTWGADGQILFASIEGEAIFGVASAGGEPEKVREPDPGVRRVCWPSFLPDGKRYLYMARKADKTFRIMLGEPGQPGREVRAADSFAQYVSPGYLVFARDGTLLAQRFDAASGEVSGEPIAIAQPVASFATVGWASFAVSPNGVLAYASPGDRARLTWFDRSGHQEPLESESTAAMLWVRFSPDGRQALFNRADARTGNLDIWALDVERGVETRMTSDPDTETFGLLLPDGDLVYSEPRGASPQLLRRNLATGETRELLEEGGFQMVQDRTPDGKTLVYAERIGYGAWDLFTIPAAGGTPQPLLQTAFDEIDLRLSPDGRYAAFVSSEPGRPEVYVAPFPRLAEKVRVTQEGAWSPRWSRDGRELFYLTANRGLVTMPVRTGATLDLGVPKTLFSQQGRYPWASYDVAPDGRFLAIVPEALSTEQPLTVVVDGLADARDAPRR